MHTIAKLTRNEDGQDIPKDEQKWCLVYSFGDSDQLFCSSEVFGFAEGDAVAQIKQVKRGGITCLKCLQEIKTIKAIKL